MTTIADFTVTTNRGESLDLSTKQGKVLLVVNTASKCGFTPQYDGLEELYQQFKDKDFEVLGFPCNQFGRQEPGSNQEIKEFAAGYNVKFDMYSKICVNGDDAHPLWKWMKVQPKGRGMLGNAIKWNFTKFLIDKNGCVVKRYGPMEEPQVIEKDLPCYL